MAALRVAIALLLTATPLFAAEDDAEIARGLMNLRFIHAIAQVIDTRIALGTGAPRLQTQVDPWGTPYRIDTMNGYRIVGAGSDRAFEDDVTRPSMQFEGTAGDVDFENGQLIRSNRNWLYARVVPGGASAKELDELKKAELLLMMMRSPVALSVTAIQLTSASMEELASRVEKHRTQYGDLTRLAPPNDPIGVLLADIVDPNDRLHRDAWGTPYRASVEGDAVRIVSAGADRKFDPDSWSRPPAVDAAEDIVHEKGAFARRVDPPALLKQTVPEAQAIAQPPDPSLAGGKWVNIAPPVQRPEVLDRIEPKYPEDYRRARISGLVILQLAISETGVVEDVRILKSKAPDLDMAAVAAAKSWKFRPATNDGKPVPVLFNLTINFKLN